MSTEKAAERFTAREAEGLIERITAGEIDEVFLVLSKPIRIGDTATVTELRIAEPNVRQLKVMDGAQGEMHKMQRLLAAINDKPDPIFDFMGAKDMIAASALIAAFLGVAPPIGGT